LPIPYWMCLSLLSVQW
jgi:NhaP-type Na+/H+ or K+/H+ antiporter